MVDATDEPPRPDPGFRVYVQRGLGAVAGPGPYVHLDVTHAVMDAYDIAVNSLDFGSGFLSTEEVDNLRALGKAIGAQRFDYQHDKCLRCGDDSYDHCLPEKACSTCSCVGYVHPAEGEAWATKPSTEGA